MKTFQQREQANGPSPPVVVGAGIATLGGAAGVVLFPSEVVAGVAGVPEGPEDTEAGAEVAVALTVGTERPSEGSGGPGCGAPPAVGGTSLWQRLWRMRLETWL